MPSYMDGELADAIQKENFRKFIIDLVMQPSEIMYIVFFPAYPTFLSWILYILQFFCQGDWEKVIEAVSWAFRTKNIQILE